MQLVIDRLKFKDDLSIIISLDEREDLDHKPSPDGYLEAIKVLDTTPSSTIVLEDSNPGIAAAKAAGAYVVGLKLNLLPGYIQTGADMYVDKIDEIARILTY